MFRGLLLALLGCAPLAAAQRPAPPVRQATSAQQGSTSPTQPNVTLPAPQQAPRVSFRNGLLSINAQNSSLADVLSAVHRATGASLEMPPSASSERVAVNLGPGPANQVMASLLDGAPYDYVLLNRANNPNDLQAMILRARINGAGDNNMQAANQPAPATAVEQPEEQPEQEPDQEAPPGVENQDQQVTEQPQPPQPGQPQPGQPQLQPGQPQPAQQQNAEGDQQQPKTPEQLLQELQRMQQQQQQQIQQQQGQPQQQQSDQQQPQSQDEGDQQPPQPQEADTPPPQY